MTPILRRGQNAWIPTPEAMDKAQNQIGRMVLKKFPWASITLVNEEIPAAAFSLGYAIYMEKIADDPKLRVEHPDRYVIEIGYFQGCKQIVSWARRNNREDLLAATSEPSEDGDRTSRSMESVMATVAEVEKSSPASKVIQNERRDAILGAIKALTPKQRKSVLDVHVNGVKHEAAAKSQGVSLRVFERCLDTATAKLAWRVSLTSSDAMCSTYQDLVLSLKKPMEPSKDEHKHLGQHVTACQECRHAVYDAPMVIDVGALLATGAFTAAAGPSVGDRVLSSPVVEGPMDLGRAIVHKVTPGGGGGSHAAEAAAGAGSAGGAGAGGAALFVGAKAALVLCAGAAATVCVGAATGVIPLTETNSDKDSKADAAVERAAAGTSVRAEPDDITVQQAERVKTAFRKARAKERRAERRVARKQAAERATSARASTAPEEQQLSYTSPTTTAEPTSQSAANQASADQSMGIPAAPPPAPAPPPPAQTQTNQSSANDSMGCC